MKHLISILTIAFLVACSTHQTPLAPCTTPPSLKKAWFNQNETYRLRHDGVILINDTSIPITGLMTMDMREGKAKTALLTGLGFPLATLEITSTDYTVIQLSPLARKIPLFAEQYAFSIQQTFLANFPGKNTICTETTSAYTLTSTHLETTIRTTVDQSGIIARKEYVSPHDEISIEYGNTFPISETYLPLTTTLINADKRYSVILKLNNAETQ